MRTFTLSCANAAPFAAAQMASAAISASARPPKPAFARNQLLSINMDVPLLP